MKLWSGKTFLGAWRGGISVSMEMANLYSLVAAPPALLLAAIFVLIWGFDGSTFERTPAGVVLVYLAVVAAFVAHEAIHGLTWAYFGGRPLSAIKFGFQAKTLMPYAHCKESMEARAYRLGTAMPGLLLGILPSLAGIVTGNGWIMLFGVFFHLRRRRRRPDPVAHPQRGRHDACRGPPGQSRLLRKRVS